MFNLGYMNQYGLVPQHRLVEHISLLYQFTMNTKVTDALSALPRRDKQGPRNNKKGRVTIAS